MGAKSALRSTARAAGVYRAKTAIHFCVSEEEASSHQNEDLTKFERVWCVVVLEQLDSIRQEEQLRVALVRDRYRNCDRIFNDLTEEEEKSSEIQESDMQIERREHDYMLAAASASANGYEGGYVKTKRCCGERK